MAAESNPAVIYEALAPAILGGRIFEGFKNVAKADSGVILPAWVINCVQSEGDNYLEGVDVAAK